MKLGPGCPTQSVCLTKLKRSLPGGFIFSLPKEYHNHLPVSSPMSNTSIVDSHPYLDVEGVSEYFSIPPRMIWKLIAAGQLSASRVGRKWNIETKSIFAYLKRNKNTEVA